MWELSMKVAGCCRWILSGINNRRVSETDHDALPVSLAGKKGAALTLRDIGQDGSWVENLPKVIKLGPFWTYSWGAKGLEKYLQPSNIDFLPMIYGYYGEDMFEQQLQDIKHQNPRLVPSFNEPDHADQSNLSVRLALEVWPRFESLGIPIVSPSCANPLGDWMKFFMDQTTSLGYRVDAIGVHSYSGIDIQAFQSRLQTIHELYKRPLILTEFAVADWNASTPEENHYDSSQVLDFMKATLPWIEAQDWIIGFAWFSFSIDSPVGTCSALFDDDGNLTACGKFYADWRPDDKVLY
jgi:hypothetical protein